jgi:hypothetical protein
MATFNALILGLAQQQELFFNQLVRCTVAILLRTLDESNAMRGLEVGCGDWKWALVNGHR